MVDNSPNLENLLQMGVNAAKNGNKEGARLFFQQVLEQDKRNERAWLWMASIADNEIDKRRYLETVLKINPNNNTARKHLGSLNSAVTNTESASMRFGIMILIVVGGVVALAVVLALILSN
jgi:hypothetical protein